MTLKDFLQNKTLIAVEILGFNYNQIVNVYIDGGVGYGLNVDLSNVPCGTPLEYRTDFTLQGDILSVSNLSINLNNVEMLG
jgi:hypothetical protein